LVIVASIACVGVAVADARAQSRPDSISRVVVSGAVFDSVAGKPLSGARIQLARVFSTGDGNSYATASDSTGRFAIPGVIAGRYYIAFYHQVLDTIGVEARDQVIEVAGRTTEVRLAVPSAHTMARSLCPTSARSASAGLLIGHVRSGSDESAVVEGIVAVRWSEPRANGASIDIADYGADVRTKAQGFFFVCDAASALSLYVSASKGSVSSGEVTVRVPPDSLRHITLYVGDVDQRSAESNTIQGTIRDAARSPIGGVSVSVVGSERVVASAPNGTFRIDSVPLGTRTLFVRAIGYSPQEIVVQVLRGRPMSVDISMEKAVVLPAVETRGTAASLDLAEFNEHRRTGAGGFFITPTRLDGYVAMQSLHSLVSALPGVNIGHSRGEATISMRRPAKYMVTGSATEACTPRIYLNGVRSDMTFGELDRAYDAETIAGIEIYTRFVQVPSYYPSDPANQCGLVAIWLRERKK
jgi:hypothetical protein